MNEYYESVLEEAGWTLLRSQFGELFAYAVHRATGQIVYIEFDNDDDDPVGAVFETVEALTTKQFKNRKEVAR